MGHSHAVTGGSTVAARRRRRGWRWRTGLATLVTAATVTLPAAASAQPSPRPEALPCPPGLATLHVGGQTACTHGDDQHPQFAELDAVDEELAAGPPRPLPCRGDGSSGRRVQVLYVRASDVPGDLAAARPKIHAAIAGAAEAVDLSAQETGGFRQIQFLMDANCDLSITEVVVPPSGDDNFVNTIDAVDALGYRRGDRRYLMFTEADVYCGVGTGFDDDTPGATNLNNGATDQPSGWARMDKDCWGYVATTHELWHTLGSVNSSTPHSTKNGHCYDDEEIMCYDDDGTADGVVHRGDGSVVAFQPNACAAGRMITLDCNNDDYFSTAPPAGSYLATHWNTAKSAFLTTALPHSPRKLTSVPENGAVTLKWTAPLTYGGTAITDYVVRAYRGKTPVATVSTGSPSVTTVRLTGLTNGAAHTFFVQAVNASGRGPATTIRDTPDVMKASFTVPSRAGGHTPSTADQVAAHFSQPVRNVTAANVGLRTISGTSLLLARSVTCFSVTGAKVNCAATTVRRADVVPAAPIVGEQYVVVVNPSGADPVVGVASGAAVPAATSPAFQYDLANEDYASFGWATVRDTAALGGSFTTERAAGATATYQFTGTAVQWRARVGPDHGTATVTVDGRSPTTVNLYRAAAGFQEIAFTGLTDRVHTLAIAVNGAKGDAAGTDTRVSIDAFRVGDVTANTPAAAYTWARAADSQAQDGAYAWSDLGSPTGPRASFRYRGTSFWVGFRATASSGRVQIYVDNALCGTFSTAKSPPQTVFAGCSAAGPGLHSVKVIAIDPGSRVALDSWLVPPPS